MSVHSIGYYDMLNLCKFYTKDLKSQYREVKRTFGCWYPYLGVTYRLVRYVISTDDTKKVGDTLNFLVNYILQHETGNTLFLRQGIELAPGEQSSLNSEAMSFTTPINKNHIITFTCICTSNTGKAAPFNTHLIQDELPLEIGERRYLPDPDEAAWPYQPVGPGAIKIFKI